MRRTLLLLSMMALTLVVASGVALAIGVGSAATQSSVVGPGESIQKAVNAADPGDTIVVRGVHREDVVIRKDGIELRGDDAVIEPPAKADSPCSKAFGPEAICVLGDVNVKTGELTGPRVKDVSVSGFTFRGFEVEGKGDDTAYTIDVSGARNATIAENRAIGNVAGGIIAGGSSINTTVANNDVIGNPKSNVGGIQVDPTSRNTKVVNNVVRSNEDGIGVDEAINTTIAGNDVKADRADIAVANSTGTKILSNTTSGPGFVGIFVGGPAPANVKIVGNNISGDAWGIYAFDTQRGSVTGNNVHDNCAGMFFENFASQPVGGFEVKGNTVQNNTRSCRGPEFGRKFSGIGIALLGAREMEVAGNHLSGNVPSGPTAISGGVVVSKNPYFRGRPFAGTAKPKNNSLIGNHFGRNKPDIFWDKSGSGNRFVGNDCNTSVPTRLCN